MCTSIIIIIIIMYYGKLSKFAKVLENARFPGSLAEDRISWTKKRFFTLAMWINSTQQSKHHQQVPLIDSTKGPILSTNERSPVKRTARLYQNPP